MFLGLVDFGHSSGRICSTIKYGLVPSQVLTIWITNKHWMVQCLVGRSYDL